MELEHLTKSQIVLLCLFVSFVSSMATGIVTVTLMQQAPEPVLQSITNVVEKTIEKVTPTIVEKPGQTVVIKDEDLIVAAIERNNKSTVAFRIVGSEDGEIRSAGVGTIVSKDGLVVTDRGNIGGGVLATTVDGIKYALDVIPSESTSSLVLGRLTPITPPASTTPPVVFTPVSFGDLSKLKVGQTALTLGGRDAKTVATGLISGIDVRTITDKDTKTETTTINSITVSQRLGGVSNGAPAITLSGEVVAFLSIDESIGSQVGVPVSVAQKLITAYQESQKATTQKAR